MTPPVIAPRATAHVRRRRLLLGGAGTALGLALAPWRIAHANPADAAAAPVVRIAGTASGTAGMALLASAYMRAHPGTRVEVTPATGNAGGIRAVIDGRADLAMSHRAPNFAERALAPLEALPYARTPFVLAVHRDLGIERLSTAELAALYRDESPSFRNGRRARAVLHLADTLDTELLRSMSPAVAAGLEQAAGRCGVLDAATDAHCADLVERTPGAFGPSTMALIDSEMRPLTPLAIDGFPPPTPENVTSGHYPWSKPLLLVQRDVPTRHAAAFVDFVCSPGARRLLATTGYCTA